MLDDLKLMSEIDKENMLDDLAKFHTQIKEAEEIVNSSNLSSIFKVDNIVISGMGASAISGDIVQTLFRDRLDIPIHVTRQYDLPKWVHKDTLLISQSYSGNTEETLHTFKHGYQKRCKIIGISSGGKLEEYCEKRQIPYIKIPSGIQPRAATAYILFASLFALKKVGVIKEDYNTEINEVISITEELGKNINKHSLEKDNLAKQLAKKLHNTIPQVYGWGLYYPIARRWCTQFNENSKIICRFDEVSECNHNDIVGWSMNPEVSKKFTCILFRDEELETVYMKKRLEFMKKLYNDVANSVIEIHMKGKKKLAKMMYAMYLGDFISCYIAMLRKIDPSPVVAIAELKNELATI